MSVNVSVTTKSIELCEDIWYAACLDCPWERAADGMAIVDATDVGLVHMRLVRGHRTYVVTADDRVSLRVWQEQDEPNAVRQIA